MAVLREIPAFLTLPDETLSELALRFGEEEWPEGSVVVSEGQAIDTLYVLAGGRTEVSSSTPTGPVTLSTQEPGEMFGELALLADNRRRHARTTVTALAPLQLLSLTAEAVEPLVARFPELRTVFETPGEIMQVARFLKRASPFARLSPARTQWLASRLDVLPIAAGTDVVRQGDAGDTCYLVRGGLLEVTALRDGEEQTLSTLRRGMMFGEAALLSEEPNHATVRAVESCELLALRRQDLLAAMEDDRTVSRALVELVRLHDLPRQALDVTAHQRRNADGETITILKHTREHRYYRLSASGWFIWQRLDGKRTIRDLTLDYREAFGSFAPHLIADLVWRLAAGGFVVLRALRADVARLTTERSSWQRATGAAKGALEWQVGLRNVDGLLDRMYRGGVFVLFTPLGQALLALLALLGFVGFALSTVRATNFIADTNGGAVLLVFLIPAEWLSVLVHEAGHAFTTKAFGREVNRAGLGWYWFGPVTFVDTSDMWLADRWPRIAVSLAGPYANVLLASIAACVGWRSSNALVTAVCWQFALTSYAIVLINLNPLLEYDGYYILMDLLERPNLRARCLRWLRAGLPRALRRPAEMARHRVELVYGLASLAYVGAMAVVALVVYRLVAQHWMESLLPGRWAGALAWLLAAGVVAATIMAVAEDMRGQPREGIPI